MHGTERRAKVLNVVRVSSGNFLEMFDFMFFGYYASSIGRTFFPNENPFASLMLASVLGIAMLSRPGHTLGYGSNPARVDAKRKTAVI
jgi:hypothetical protein